MRFFYLGCIFFSVVFIAVKLKNNSDSAEVYLAQENFSITSEVGSIGVTRIPIKNIGKKDLLLNELSTSCGCMTPELENFVVKPGEEVEIPITYRDIYGAGVRDFQFMCTTNDSSSPILYAV